MKSESIKDLKAMNAREWKNAPEEEKMAFSCFLKEKYQGNLDTIHLYYETFAYLKNDYHSLGLLQDICLLPGKDFVYALVKHDNTYAKILYCSKASNYKMDEIFIEFFVGVVHNIERKSVSFYIFLCF